MRTCFERAQHNSRATIASGSRDGSSLSSAISLSPFFFFFFSGSVFFPQEGKLCSGGRFRKDGK